MARKSAAVLDGPVPVTRSHYADYPACLPQYKWLVELALKNPEQMFNLPTVAGPSYCKVCGASYKRQDFTAHVNEHARQLKLNTYGGQPKVVTEIPVRVYDVKDGQLDIDSMREVTGDEPDAEEVLLTVLDILREKMPELDLDWTDDEGAIADALMFDLSAEVEESDMGDIPMCEDCKEG